jgi:hypothetical protein
MATRVEEIANAARRLAQIADDMGRVEQEQPDTPHLGATALRKSGSLALKELMKHYPAMNPIVARLIMFDISNIELVRGRLVAEGQRMTLRAAMTTDEALAYGYLHERIELMEMVLQDEILGDLINRQVNATLMVARGEGILMTEVSSWITKQVEERKLKAPVNYAARTAELIGKTKVDYAKAAIMRYNMTDEGHLWMSPPYTRLFVAMAAAIQSGMKAPWTDRAETLLSEARSRYANGKAEYVGRQKAAMDATIQALDWRTSGHEGPPPGMRTDASQAGTRAEGGDGGMAPGGAGNEAMAGVRQTTPPEMMHGASLGQADGNDTNAGGPPPSVPRVEFPNLTDPGSQPPPHVPNIGYRYWE